MACATGDLAAASPLSWRPLSAVTVVVAAEGYPGAPSDGDEVVVGELPTRVSVVHAGTRRDGERVLAAGGRVLSVTGVGPDLAAARAAAYDGVAAVSLRGGFSRTDIGARAARGEICLPTEQESS